jgi:hypothetical protein
MSKKIEELSIEEAQEVISKISLTNKQLDFEKVQLRKMRDRLSDVKKSLKESKSKKITSIRNDIAKTENKILKVRKKADMQREAESFDNRIKSKAKEIDALRDKINDIDEKKTRNNVIAARIKQQINNLKK